MHKATIATTLMAAALGEIFVVEGFADYAARRPTRLN
jgi:hypothetical protein